MWIGSDRASLETFEMMAQGKQSDLIPISNAHSQQAKPKRGPKTAKQGTVRAADDRPRKEKERRRVDGPEVRHGGSDLMASNDIEDSSKVQGYVATVKSEPDRCSMYGRSLTPRPHTGGDPEPQDGRLNVPEGPLAWQRQGHQGRRGQDVAADRAAAGAIQGRRISRQGQGGRGEFWSTLLLTIVSYSQVRPRASFQSSFASRMPQLSYHKGFLANVSE